MPGRWTENHPEDWRARDDEPFFYGRERETRSFQRDRRDAYAARRSGLDRDRVFGERESGASYGRAGRPRSVAALHLAGLHRRRPLLRRRQPERIYREEYGQGGVEYGDTPRGYDAERDYDARERYSGRAAYDRGGYGEAGLRPTIRRDPRAGFASGGTGGYDYERGYGDGGRREGAASAPSASRTPAATPATSCIGPASGWPPGSAAAARRAPTTTTTAQDRGARGLGPQGYKRSDDRISDEVHERLTDDAWLDASQHLGRGRWRAR